jgi:hypothetical protein
MFTNSYVPSVVAVIDRDTFVRTSVSLTSAAAMTARCESTMVPTTAP